MSNGYHIGGSPKPDYNPEAESKGMDEDVNRYLKRETSPPKNPADVLAVVKRGTKNRGKRQSPKR